LCAEHQPIRGQEIQDGAGGDRQEVGDQVVQSGAGREQPASRTAASREDRNFRGLDIGRLLATD